jgi:lipopolysaccharide/colanic/teichoic acid biosynthesis glycosyltransferase
MLLHNIITVFSILTAIIGIYMILTLAYNIKIETREKEVNSLVLGFNNEGNSLYHSKAYYFSKRLMDILFAFIGIFLLFPMLIFTYIMVLLSSPGPVFVKSIRIGKGGSPFGAYKFRTFRWDKKGSQITKIGRFLRMTSIEEIPLLFNVLRGDMSIIGMSAYDMSSINDLTDSQKEIILSLKPGIVSLWDISWNREKKELNEKVKFDMYYVNKMSLTFDIKIILKTITIVLGRTGEF